ncbi:MAG: hypothetical protein [Siphoviridae sp. ctdEk19]|nr:MAG: hypothetical protein [Siphoviridae sp. ctdEk19]
MGGRHRGLTPVLPLPRRLTPTGFFRPVGLVSAHYALD